MLDLAKTMEMLGETSRELLQLLNCFLVVGFWTFSPFVLFSSLKNSTISRYSFWCQLRIKTSWRNRILPSLKTKWAICSFWALKIEITAFLKFKWSEILMCSVKGLPRFREPSPLMGMRDLVTLDWLMAQGPLMTNWNSRSLAAFMALWTSRTGRQTKCHTNMNAK